jgi:two-component system, sporulation sensor kinase E
MTPPEEAPLFVDSGSGSQRRAGRVRAAGLVALMVVAITLLLAFTPHDAFNGALLQLYRRLYYIPIVYAAFVFGRRGGIVTGAACSILFWLYATISHMSGVLTMQELSSFEAFLEIAMFLSVGTLFGALRDNEERRTRDLRQVSLQLEEAYKKLEERAIQLINIQDYTQSILRSITSGVLTVGPDASITTANPAAERMLGMSEFEMVPKPIGALFRDDGGISSDVSKVLVGRVPLALREVTLVTAGGKTVHVQASTSRMRAVGGRILGAVVTVEDVSDVKALTDQLIRADRLAAMGELTAGVAHEVRNPLGVIRASVQLLEDAKCDQQRIEEAAGIIKQEIDRLDRVIKALLDFGRPSTPTLVRTDVESVLDDVLLFTKRFATQGDVEIERVSEPLLPPVLADPDQLKQVFLNLVTNAVQAMEATGGRIVITTRSQGDFVQVEVADNGPGIPAEDLSKIFDPFYSRRSGGTGLGLTIVHRIVDEHGGHIEVESSDSGTTFRVSLPILMEE